MIAVAVLTYIPCGGQPHIARTTLNVDEVKDLAEILLKVSYSSFIHS